MMILRDDKMPDPAVDQEIAAAPATVPPEKQAQFGRGSWLVLAALIALLVLSAIAVFPTLGLDGANTGQGISSAGLVAMILGAVGSLALGGGLMALTFYSARSGHDGSTRQYDEANVRVDDE